MKYREAREFVMDSHSELQNLVREAVEGATLKWQERYNILDIMPPRISVNTIPAPVYGGVPRTRKALVVIHTD